MKTCYQYISFIVIFSNDQRIYNINVRKEFHIPIEGVPLLSISSITNATQWDLVSEYVWWPLNYQELKYK